MADPHRELEHRRKLATAHSTKRFGKLLKMMRHDAFLPMVWQKVRSNQGSRTPGVDGHTRDNIDEQVLYDLATTALPDATDPSRCDAPTSPNGASQDNGAV